MMFSGGIEANKFVGEIWRRSLRGLLNVFRLCNEAVNFFAISELRKKGVQVNY